MTDFPSDFLWGASTSSYQIEGGNTRSALWDWERRKGWERSAGAAGSWDRFEEDLACLKALNLKAYRFSVEWSRIQPEPNAFSEEVLERYAHWAQRLKEEGIRPFLCFHHFSEPAWLLREHPDGWLDEGVPARFLRFVEKTTAALKDHVNDWIIFNEPLVFLVGAYGMGHFPPGRWMLLDADKEFNPIVVKNMAKAHIEGYKLVHRLQPGASVGVAHHVSELEPARPCDGPAVEIWDRFMHLNYLDQIKDHLDFLGINYYTRIFVRSAPLPLFPMKVFPGYAEMEEKMSRFLFKLLGGRRGDRPRTGMDWEIVPEGLGSVVSKLWGRYGKPIYITENGLADQTGELRESFIRDHLASLAAAMKEGADVRGYLHWSLIDNYEWGSYRPRFGLFTRERKPAAGSAYYGEVARTGKLG